MVGFAVSYLGIIAATAGAVVEKVIPISRCDPKHRLSYTNIVQKDPNRPVFFLLFP